MKKDGTGSRLEQLRKKAEKNISGTHKKAVVKVGPEGEMLHKLQLYQVELEMQNDELRISQAQLEKERQRVAGLFNLAPVGYFVLDENGMISECNEVACRLLAKSRSRLLKSRFQKFIAPESADVFYLLVRKLAHTGKLVSGEIKMCAPEGNFFYADIQATGIKTDTKPQIYLAVTDVTARRLFEIKERETAERLRMCLAASSAGTWEIELQDRTISLDDFARKIYGVDQNSFDGSYTSFLGFVVPDARDRFDASVRKALVSGNELNTTYQIIDASGKLKDIEARGHIKSVGGDREVFVGLITDISIRKNLERKAEEIREQQQRTNLRTIVDTEERERARISAALHDSVGQLLYATMLKLQQSEPADQNLNDSRNLLDLAIRETRNISFELAPSILADFGLAVAIPEMIRRITSTSLKVSTHLSGVSVRLSLFAETFVFRIVQELLNNVIKHADASEAKVDLKNAKSGIIIRVSDNGRGFDPTKLVPAGTGLYSIKNRIGLYNGSLDIRSGEKKGTAVTVQLFNLGDRADPDDREN